MQKSSASGACTQYLIGLFNTSYWAVSCLAVRLTGNYYMVEELEVTADINEADAGRLLLQAIAPCRTAASQISNRSRLALSPISMFCETTESHKDDVAEALNSMWTIRSPRCIGTVRRHPNTGTYACQGTRP